MMAKKLKDGDDSLAVSQKVKRQLFVDAVGICAEPKCNSRLMESRTTLGECAHIIPRKVGSHPREDYQTPLEDRKKEPNLLYLCLKHHKLVDDKEHKEDYTAQTLREWKKHHEAFAAGISKSSPPIPQQASKSTILQLMSACRSYLDSYRINEARAFLSQIDILLLDIDDATLNAEADFLGAILVARNEKTPEAKEQLLEIIRAHPNYIEPMLEYIELCGSAPEPTDELERIEKLARAIDKNHPHLLLIDLFRKYKNGDIIKDESIFEIKTDNTRLTARFISQHSLFCDTAGDTTRRDALVEQWQKFAPNSPNPYRFKAMYKMIDVIRNSPEQADLIDEALKFSKQQRQEIEDKDPLMPHGQIEWLLNELKLRVALFRITGEDTGFDAVRNDMILWIAQCYFDSAINAIVADLLAYLSIEPDQWRIITGKIQESNVAPSKDLIEVLFLHALPHNDLFDDLIDFIKKYNQDNLLEILQAIKNNDAPKTAKLINAKHDSNFSLMVLQSIRDYDVAVPLTELLEIKQDYQSQFLTIRLGILVMYKQDRRALDLITEPIIDEANLFMLHIIEELTYKNEQLHFFIPAALRLLTLHIPDGYKIQLHGKLSMVYFGQKDDTNAIMHAEHALVQPEDLGEDNSHNIFGLMVQALMNKGQVDKACGAFAQYHHIKPTFEFFGTQAQCYLKSSFDDRYEKAVSCIVQAFEITEAYNDNIYLSAFNILLELSNAGAILAHDEPAVKDGLFVKLEGISDWLYIGGQEKSLGAECISPDTDSHAALIGKSVLDKIDWPADEYSGYNDKRTILHITTPARFLSHRASEAMAKAAQLGNTSIRTFRVIDDDGKLDMSGFERFMEEQDQPRKDFFESYISNGLPFAFLCKMQGSIQSALGIVSLEERGFIQCNNRTQADIEEQKAIANKVLGGAPCFIEGLVAVMLAESGLIEDVVKALPNLGVSTSVIGLLRDIAGNFEVTAGKGGRGDFVKGKFQFREIDKAKDGVIRNKLLAVADLLDGLPGKVVGKTYPKSDGDVNLDNTMPNYFVDAFRYAQDKTAYVLTDDSLFVHAYKVAGETQIPQNFSSISLIRAMVDKGLIDLQRYYEYFARLSYYRYYFLPLSVDDMMNVVLPRSDGGVLIPAPQNISLLNLPLTLSQDYGVEAKNAVAVLSIFFMRLIMDNTVLPEVADKIFTQTLSDTMVKRDKKSMAAALRQGCRQNMMDERWINNSSKQKLEMLDKQLFRIATLGAPHSLIIP